MKKMILGQDDCAPDALQIFDKEFIKVVGENRNSFIKTAKHHTPDDGYTSYYIKGNYELSISADDPYWKLCTLANEA